MSEESERKASDWMDEAESALERVGDALRQAWDETRDTRLATLEAAREAASRLGDALVQDINVARDAWTNRPSDTEPLGDEDSPGEVE
jgi:hypothetical protein